MTNATPQGADQTSYPANSPNPVSASTVPDASALGELLLTAMWPDPALTHHVGILDRATRDFKNMPVRGIPQAIQLAHMHSAKGVETYFACAEYSDSSNRMGHNVVQARAFWLDIDCGENKAAKQEGYPHVQAAQSDLTAFCHRASIPPPTHVVDSGSGLHVYWVMDQPLPRTDWLDTAAKLKALTKDAGFLADPSRTGDIASVLRIPGTYNYKYTPPRPVRLIHQSDEFLSRDDLLARINRAHEVIRSRGPTRRAPSDQNLERPDKIYGPPDLKRLQSALCVLDPVRQRRRPSHAGER